MLSLFDEMTFTRGPAMKNRFMLAPLTNTQSHKDGRLSEDEYKWLTMRAEGGFGLTMTCAAHVQPNGQGFPGQLGVFSDDHLEGLQRLAEGIKKNDSLAMVQLHHAGMRSPEDLIGGQPVSASDVEKHNARGLTTAETEQLIEDFIAAAVRSEKAGFDGVEIHGAHGYILCQFLSPEINQRTDRFGGSLENRARPIFDIIDGIRERCGKDFILGVRLSPERFGMKLGEVIEVSQRLMKEGKIDFLDMSLWDVRKEPEEEEFQGRSLMSYFTELDRGNVHLGVAGKIMTGEDARQCLENGADYVLIGRAAILHHDFPNRIQADPDFASTSLPVSKDYLAKEGLGPDFITYMSGWAGFVQE
ncbi:NADH:flavin oxidoreductase [Sneathiella chinensis]|uniref:NADH-dependent flavin oxidoreductase n=1 Tax=Sneathiella chinensis TaxID=349750 RepID=A0ABQ5U5S4_9PROT|nr:NADH:flavin oxidoreductase [Sneathiella chinensis]GLQ07259.1 NADH-dependent flavin oxidoreductase [Sneathiella chinensis]